MFNDVKKQAYEQFKIAVNQEAVERMANDVHVYGRPCSELNRLEQLAEIFHEFGNPATVETYRTLRRHSLQYRDSEYFLAFADSQYNWFDSARKNASIYAREHKPELRAVS